MKIQIKHKITNNVLFECDAESIQTSVKLAIEAKADLSSANLRSANLRSANLRSANLRSANLSFADLRGADLRGADLRRADLRGADLRGANLRSADLRRADLRSANLSFADLRGAVAIGANFDFACWPLKCGGTKVNIDARLSCQLAYHLFNQDHQDAEIRKTLEPIRALAERFVSQYRTDAIPVRKD